MRGRGAVGLAVVVVAGVVAAAALGVALSVGQDREDGEDRVPGGTATTTGTVPGQWRTERWRDLAVDVPADWAYGGAPMDSAGDTVACYAAAMVSASGDDLPGGTVQPYVGRPIALTDVCQVYPFIGPDTGPPAAPYVWLGAAVEPGTEDLGVGWIQETVEVNGSILTVATDDPGLRRRILDSATGGETCMSEVDLAGETFPRTSGGDVEDAESLTVCAYRRVGEPGSASTAELTYAVRLGRPAVTGYLAALADGDAPRDQCPDADFVEGEWVALELGDSIGEVVRRDVVHLACPGIDVGAEDLSGFELVELTPQMVRPWAANGIPAVVYGPGGGKGAMLESFIGPQG